MGKDVINKFKRIKIDNATYDKIVEFSKKHNKKINETLRESFEFYSQNKLYEEFAKSPANELMDEYFEFNKENLKAMQKLVEDFQKQNIAKFNELLEFIEKLNEQVKFQNGYIKDISGFLLEKFPDKGEEE
ncbi:MAG: hypothetical protein LBC44_00700 [Mycoplasmataceae bacterium]|jgi:aminopeptidase-like protein|nr:hypothetical protein [Mycoplasmataceae bacterium]